jgi:tungstate transport system substrate-binding protein
MCDRTRSVLRWCLVMVFALASGCGSQPGASVPPRPAGSPQTIRCSVVGGLADTGLWQELSKKFTEQTGHQVEIVARGPKHQIVDAVANAQAHLMAMHSSDVIINLVADGYLADPQPWLRNDFILVGPEDDPAGIRGLTDAGEALRRIITTKSRFLIHSSHGSMELLRNVMEDERLEFDEEQLIVSIQDRHRQMLMLAGQEKAYTLIGRIPFINGKIPKRDMDVMVQGDRRLRRPYLVAVAARGRFPDAEITAARQLAEFLRTSDTQAWIADYGRGVFDDSPLFFPVNVSGQLP